MLPPPCTVTWKSEGPHRIDCNCRSRTNFAGGLQFPRGSEPHKLAVIRVSRMMLRAHIELSLPFCARRLLSLPEVSEGSGMLPFARPLSNVRAGVACQLREAGQAI
jgi:hypothetical protein